MWTSSDSAHPRRGLSASYGESDWRLSVLNRKTGTAEQGWRPASLWRVRCRGTERYEPKCVSANSVRSGMRLRADVFPVATSWSYLMRKLSL